MHPVELGDTVLVVEPGGDRPAILTKVFSGNQAEACGYMPLPLYLKVVTVHEDRRTAVNAGVKDATGYHAYPKPHRKS
jgi:hypothetical protein